MPEARLLLEPSTLEDVGLPMFDVRGGFPLMALGTTLTNAMGSPPHSRAEIPSFSF